MNLAQTSLPNSLRWLAFQSKQKQKARNQHPAFEDFTLFKRALYKRYTHPAHLDILDRELMEVERFVRSGGSEGTWLLIVSMPPRHGKTLTVSRLFPPWFLGRNPECRAMLVSYGATLAHKNSRYARGIMQSEEYRHVFPDLELDRASRAVDAWDLAEFEGGADAMGVLGGATGKGAHLLIADDLIKNRQEAESEQIRDRTWDAILDDLLSRLEPGGAVVMFATRWQEDDAIGRMIKLTQNPAACNGPVKVLNFVSKPETAEEVADDPLGRGLDVPLWPERYPLKVLQAIKERVGPYSWASLYQGRPTPAEGGIFKRAWFDPVDRTPPVAYAVRFWDLAMSEKTSADYTAGVKIGQASDGHYYVLDVARAQIEWGDLTEYIAQVILRDGPSVAQGVEKKGFMARAIQDLNADPRLHGYQIWGYPVDEDKLTRALPVAAKWASGNLHMVTGHWNRAFVEEVCAFKNGAHDDQVDAMSGAWAMMDPEIGTGDLTLATEDDYGIGPY